MPYICVDDFFEKTSKIIRLTRQEEKDLAVLMKNGNVKARERIIENYTVIIASRIKRLPKQMQSLDLIYRCILALERAVDEFNFLQDGETFIHRLSLIIQKEINSSIADE